MKSKQVNKKSIDLRPVNWLVGGAALITIYFNSKIQDPFNAPKAWILLLVSAWLSGFLVINFRSITTRVSKTVLIIPALFIVFNFFALLLSKNKQVALLGENMRRDGFLTYFSFIIFLYAGISYIRFTTIRRFFLYALITSFILGIYGIMQWTGNDFVQWSDHGNNVISTLGNSNFAGSMMAILAVLMFGGFLSKSFSFIYRIFFLVAMAVLLVAILPTNARQALVILVLGVGLILTFFVSNYKPLIAKIMAILGLFSGVLAILGMLQIGPLRGFLYKDSVTVRGFYWRAGLKMFQDNPFFGVGLDNYGAYFKEYRSVLYPLKYGFNLTSTNAHNVVIQQFATGGIFVGALYLAIVFLIAIRGIKALRKATGDKRVILGTLFAAWIAYQAQSVISIDNIGISVWGWVLGGAILGLTIEINKNDQNSLNLQNLKSSNFDFRQPILSSALFAVTAIFVVIFYRGESAIFQQRASFNPSNSAQAGIFHELAKKTINTPFVDQQYKIMTASYLGGMGFTEESMKLLSEMHSSDPRNLDTLILLAAFNEQLGKYQVAIDFRNEIAKLDPWNAENFLVIGRNYKALGDKVNMQKALDVILSFASSDPVATSAKSELVLQ